jgi:hypothetical protein
LGAISVCGFGSIGVGFGSIGVGFGFRAGGGGNIAVGLGLAGCPAAGDTGEAEGVTELWEAAVAKEALAACCFLLSWSFWSPKRQPSPKNRIQKTICLITGGYKPQQSSQNRAGEAMIWLKDEGHSEKADNGNAETHNQKS